MFEVCSAGADAAREQPHPIVAELSGLEAVAAAAVSGEPIHALLL
jgi:hypothetical protein